MNMLDMVIQFAKELKGMQAGNRTLQLKVNTLKRQLGESHETIRRWKEKHQTQHDIADHVLNTLYAQAIEDSRITADVPYAVWRYDYLYAHGFIKEDFPFRPTATVFEPEDMRL